LLAPSLELTMTYCVLTVSTVYYRAEAERCRERAEASPDAETARRWRALERDYTALSRAMEKAYRCSSSRKPS
jgi:hypothetical protein